MSSGLQDLRLQTDRHREWQASWYRDTLKREKVAEYFGWNLADTRPIVQKVHNIIIFNAPIIFSENIILLCLFCKISEICWQIRQTTMTKQKHRTIVYLNIRKRQTNKRSKGYRVDNHLENFFFSQKNKISSADIWTDGKAKWVIDRESERDREGMGCLLH